MTYKQAFENTYGWSAVDTNAQLTSTDGKAFLRHLKQQGVDTIIRYYASSRRAKTITLEEAKLITQEGFAILPVYQDVGRKPIEFGHINGKQHAMNALRFANYINQPKGTTIMFACDADFSEVDYRRYIRPYFAEIKIQFKRQYRIGAYGSGLILDNLLDDKLIEVPWLSMSRDFRGTESFFYASKWAMRQLPPPIRYGTINYDKNIKSWTWRHIGAFKYEEQSNVNDDPVTEKLLQIKSFLKDILSKLTK